MLNIAKFSKKLGFFDGVWISKKSSKISYPEEGHSGCFEIEDKSFWFKHRNKVIITLLKRFQPAGALFDVGGGNGYVALDLEKNGFEVVLVEPGPIGIKNARERGLKNLVCSSLEDADFIEGSLPAVSLFDVLEHIENDVDFLKKIKNLLVSGGRLYLTVPAYGFLWSSEDKFAGHYRRYNLKSLKKSLLKAGFRIDYATYFFSFLPLPIFLLRSLPDYIFLKSRQDFSSSKEEHKGNFLLSFFLKRELLKLKDSTLPFGSSCFVVAKA